MGRAPGPDRAMRVHVKNNHASPETFPPTPEGEAVFTITRERFDAAAARYPRVARRLDVCIDWDLDHFERSMRTAEVLVTWDLPTANLARIAPKLRLIHVIGAGVEHLCPDGLGAARRHRRQQPRRARRQGGRVRADGGADAPQPPARHPRQPAPRALGVAVLDADRGEDAARDRHRQHRRRGRAALPGARDAGARRVPARPPPRCGRRDAHHRSPGRPPPAGGLRARRGPAHSGDPRPSSMRAARRS